MQLLRHSAPGREHGTKSQQKRASEDADRHSTAAMKLQDRNSLHCVIAQAQSTKVRFPVDNAAHFFSIRAILPANAIGTDVACKETPFENRLP
jgi:hypothetical protein